TEMNLRSFFRKRSVALLACLLVLVSTVGARPIGMTHAYLANLVGVRLLMGYGLCSGPCKVADDILRERYGIHTLTVAGCVVWGPEVWYADGYNDIARPLMVRSLGKDVFQEAHDEALRTHNPLHGKQQ